MITEPFNLQLAHLHTFVEEALFSPHILVIDADGTVTARSGSLLPGTLATLLDGLSGLRAGESQLGSSELSQCGDDGTLLTLLEGIRNVLNGRLAAYRQECGFPADSPLRRFVVSVTPTAPPPGAGIRWRSAPTAQGPATS